MKKLIIIIILLFSTTARAEVGNEMDKILKKYGWYEPVLSSVNSSYSVRFKVANLLQKEGFYKAEDTPYCKGKGRTINTCYMGTPQQNYDLLKALKNHETQKYLINTTPEELGYWCL